MSRASQTDSPQHANPAAEAGQLGLVKRALVQLFPLDMYCEPVLLTTPRFTLGRDVQNDWVISDQSVSRQHAELRLTDEGTVLLDLDSTNGVAVNGTRTVAQLLANGDRIQIGSYLFRFLSTADDLEPLYESTFYSMVTRDALTRVYHHRYLKECLDRELARCRRNARALSLATIEIDDFASIVHHYRGPIADQVLCQVARRIENLVREEDILARTDAKRFCLAMIEADLEAAVEIAERIRIAVSSESIPTSVGPIRVTISLGIAGTPADRNSTPSTRPELWGGARELLRDAEERLLEAKRVGHNRSVC
jgi:diguanylate cyclase (GGDEF)-like protein